MSRLRRILTSAVLALLAALPPPGALAAADPVPAVGGAWPVGAPPWIVRGWEPPATAYGPGHRGVDLAAPPGSPVRAVAPGRVSYAGRVAGRGVLTVELAGTGDPPLRTTYEPVRASVRKGAEVSTGDLLGTVEASARSHCPTACLHWGLRRATAYLNPLGLLPPWLLGGGPSQLLPLTGAGTPPPAWPPWLWTAVPRGEEVLPRPGEAGASGRGGHGPPPPSAAEAGPGLGLPSGPGLSPARPAGPWPPPPP
ncbi:murein hydrolase activator EnvC family protein [Streptomyces sp. MNP-20]|uniref:murein hydrolase activator EnvC family protein n=1 Tax=Streptomyces sp. MNP-20 TaxID=2721165 RepID=UPI0035C870C7